MAATAGPDKVSLPAIEFSIQDVMLAINNQDATLKIGEGGFGQVYRGMLRGVVVAVKVLNIFQQRDTFEELSREVQAVGMIHHPNIVHLIGYAVSRDEGLFCIVYEYVDGGSVGDAIRKHKKGEAVLRYEVQLRILQDFAEALVYIHARGAVHADVKPNNILLSSDPFQQSPSPTSAQGEVPEVHAKLCDFGFTRFRHKVNDNTHTHIPMTRGGVTEGYADPVAMSEGKLSAKTDVYSMVLYNTTTTLT